jgi:hypothetical protein
MIIPTNRRLMAAPPEAATAETHRMLEQWALSMPGEVPWARGKP